MMNGWDSGITTTGWIFMTLFWVLILVLVVWAVFRLLPDRTSLAPHEPARPEDDDPETILARRLARGEIDVETYDDLRHKLGERREPAGTATS